MFAGPDRHGEWKVLCSADKMFFDGSITMCDGDEMAQSSSGAPGWQLEGNASLAYDTHIVDVFLQDYSRRLVEVAAIKPGDRVLDVACGTGVVTRLVANKIGSAGRVVGFDLNAGMLARARAAGETAAAIEWQLGNATDMPFADATFDCVICQHGLQFIPDKAAAVSEMRRVLADRGRMVISVWRSIEHCPWQAAIAGAVERHVGREQAAQIRSAFSFGDADQLRQIIVAAGFQGAEIRIERETIRHASMAEYVPGYISATPIAAAVAGLDQAAQAKITADVADALAAYRVGDGLAAPIEAHVAIGHR
jgi:ubiquinone/menaquinone biosynthesis C-methylase UbiE